MSPERVELDARATAKECVSAAEAPKNLAWHGDLGMSHLWGKTGIRLPVGLGGAVVGMFTHAERNAFWPGLYQACFSSKYVHYFSDEKRTNGSVSQAANLLKTQPGGYWNRMLPAFFKEVTPES
ncbi:predicted protein [Histoplasma capsulatum H143]|uniref:Uncharacterized protein n=1 Tax=Ajellomyces capsulatus (strain H143) TaxID=544712 RepID=C6HM73_AJECH|nr:predicted protein [Histoplasma capsulatum H143]